GFVYTVPTNIGEFGLAANWNHGGDYFSEPDNLSFTRQPSYDLVNASVSWTSSNEHFSARLWVNNLFDEEYYSYVANSGSSGTKYGPAAPATYGITLGFHY